MTNKSQGYFSTDEQTATGLPVGDESETRIPGRPWRQGVEREVGPQRPVPVRLRTPLSSEGACRPVGMTASTVTTTFRD